MIRTFICASLMMLIVGLDSASAEIYKYRDAQGIVRYTYDLAEVPEDQRPNVQAYDEAPAASEPATGESNAPAEASEKKPEKEDLVVDEKKIEELNQRKKELDAEFAGLMEEKYKLVKEKEKLTDSLAGRDTAAVAEYDAKVKKLNEKIADYQKRRDAFQKEAEEVQKALEKTEESGS